MNDSTKYLRPGHQPRTLTNGEWPFNCLLAKRDHKRICCWCGADVPKGRRAWCSQACVDDYKLKHDWPFAREAVLKRDKGVCVLCGCDTLKVRRIMDHAASLGGLRIDGRYVSHEELACRDGWEFSPHLYDQWQADHIVPRADGGSNELTNLRTLCVPCHKDVTRQFAAERAARRRRAKPLPIFGGSV